jgi:hypothetical protein
MSSLREQTLSKYRSIFSQADLLTESEYWIILSNLQRSSEKRSQKFREIMQRIGANEEDALLIIEVLSSQSKTNLISTDKEVDIQSLVLDQPMTEKEEGIPPKIMELLQEMGLADQITDQESYHNFLHETGKIVSTAYFMKRLILNSYHLLSDEGEVFAFPIEMYLSEPDTAFTIAEEFKNLDCWSEFLEVKKEFDNELKKCNSKIIKRVGEAVDFFLNEPKALAQTTPAMQERLSLYKDLHPESPRDSVHGLVMFEMFIFSDYLRNFVILTNSKNKAITELSKLFVICCRMNDTVFKCMVMAECSEIDKNKVKEEMQKFISLWKVIKRAGLTKTINESMGKQVKKKPAKNIKGFGK